MNTRRFVSMSGLLLLALSAVPAFANAWGVYFHEGDRDGWHHRWYRGYAYPRPVYVYPAYTPPPPVIIQQQPAPPPQIVVQATPPTSAVPPGYPEGSWYFCPKPQGYYPSVQNCPNGWMQVPPNAAP